MRAAAALTIGAMVLGGLLATGQPAFAQRSIAECDRMHQQQANREQCYAEVRRYENRGSGSSSEPRRSARERESTLDDCAARYERGSRSRERCFADVERRYGR